MAEGVEEVVEDELDVELDDRAQREIASSTTAAMALATNLVDVDDIEEEDECPLEAVPGERTRTIG